ncbi:hypothetical protein AB4Z32_27215 [Massilia sp. 2TAF26]|uniref:hypothetical protein n=1 Tax=Massilia sp. 2TAF26 TaxID=3233012 RepID=UPI003F9A7E50
MSEISEPARIYCVPNDTPVTLWWSNYKPELKIPTIRGTNLSRHVEFHRHALDVARRSNQEPAAFDSTMRPVAYALLEFAKYLAREKLEWFDANEETIEGFRDAAYEATVSSPTSRGEQTAKATTNIKLRIIYEFYLWADTEKLCNRPLIGWGKSFPIQSSLPLHRDEQNKWNGRARRKFPKCYRGIGENSSNPGGQYWATNADLNDIEDRFYALQPAATAARNVLFMRIADQTGLRRGSINSLVASQFTDAAIERSMKSELKAHAIRPKKQKLARNYYFEIPYALAWEVNRFLRNQYGDAMQNAAECQMNLDEMPVFISQTTGKQMTSKAWSGIFTEAFQAIGAPKGAGIHSIRRKFAEEWFRGRVQEFRDDGKPTDYQAVVAGLARVLGQDSKLSQEAYRRASAMSRGASPTDVLTEQNYELAAKNMQLTAQLEEQRGLIAKLSTSNNAARMAREHA